MMNQSKLPVADKTAIQTEKLSDLSASETALPDSAPSGQSSSGSDTQEPISAGNRESSITDKEQTETSKKQSGFKDLLTFLLIPVTVMYLEIISKLQIFGELFDGKFRYMSLLAGAMGFLFAGVPMLFRGRNRRRVIRLILSLLAVLFTVQLIYFNNFHNFYTWRSLGEAGGATLFWREALISAAGIWYMLIGVFAPLTLFCVFGKRLAPDGSRKALPFAVAGFAAFLALYLPSLMIIGSYRESQSEDNPYYNYTYIQNDIDQTFRYFGILNATRLDIKQIIFGAPVEKIDIEGLGDLSGLNRSDNQDVSQTDYGWNEMEIDFGSLEQAEDDSRYSAMDDFFSSLPPTRKNEYTGIFKGKNLIFLTLESFCPHVIDPEFTPLLYKMSTEGYIFTEFYNPMWGGSTASGEYATITGNFSPNTNCLNVSAKTYQPFALGNQFAKNGYKTLAYHNFNGYYYNRDLSHPNFGYEFKGVESGLKLATNSWPGSDREMAEASIQEYADLNPPFHVYYMTMSGHMKYNFMSNQMAYRHKKDLPEKYNDYDEEVRAFLACQYEVELMLQVIVDGLEKTGKLNDTVFAMSADHYPYAMSNGGLAELYGMKKKGIREQISLYKNSFILWTPTMTQPVTVDTPCSPVDILPTLSNMFGLEYDSRLMMGSDIMAGGEHFAPIKLSGWSWVSTQGEYNANDQTFTPNADCTLSEPEREKYIAQMNALVNAKLSFSKMILDTDYYSHIFNKPQY